MEAVKKSHIIRTVYLYLVTTISIVVVIIGAIGLLRIVLNEYVFDVKSYSEMDLENPKNIYECTDDSLLYTFDPASGKSIKKYPNKTQAEIDVIREKCLEDAKITRLSQARNDLKQEIVIWLSMLLIALPLYFVHWGIIKKENKK